MQHAAIDSSPNAPIFAGVSFSFALPPSSPSNSFSQFNAALLRFGAPAAGSCVPENCLRRGPSFRSLKSGAIALHLAASNQFPGAV